LSGKPTASDVYLLIEVADSSLLFDRRTKLPLYAREGVLEVWILNLQDNQLEVYREPKDGEFTERLFLKSNDSINDSVSLLAFPDVKISLSDIFIAPDAA